LAIEITQYRADNALLTCALKGRGFCCFGIVSKSNRGAVLNILLKRAVKSAATVLCSNEAKVKLLRGANSGSKVKKKRCRSNIRQRFFYQDKDLFLLL